tara:strand:- start:560 stop:709 length:150 start_codon:yes stop_codon:yes gene_type:complete
MGEHAGVRLKDVETKLAEQLSGLRPGNRCAAKQGFPWLRDNGAGGQAIN